MDSTTQEIKNRLDIVDFIRFYIPLTASGKNFKAPCPFHKEKTPSFMVSPDRQTWHCFGACSEGGDIFKFLMKYENLEFYEALKILAEKAGIELRRISPADQKQFGILYDINSLAKDFFKKHLTSSREVIEYAKERGLKNETVEEFELGFAPAGFENLMVHFLNLGFDVKDIERAGLIVKTDKGRYFDRFHERLMFPIHNSFGKIIGFSGRILPWADKGDAGKYVNSPETPIFNKSKVLYGFHKTKERIRETRCVVLVEGQMDFLMLYQDGLKNAAATSGTALTSDHIKTIRRFADEVILSFDNDEAGFKAAERSIDLCGAEDLSVRVLSLEEFKDPAEAVLKKPGAISELIKKAMPAMEFYFKRHLTSGEGIAGNGNIGEFKKRLRIILEKIKILASSVEQAHWLKELALRSKVNEAALNEEMEKLKSGKQKYEANNRINPVQNSDANKYKSRREFIAERILSILTSKEDLRKELEEFSDYFPPNYRRILEGITGGKEIPAELADMYDSIALRSGFELEMVGEDGAQAECRNLLRELKLEYLREERDRILYALKAAEKNGSDEEAGEILLRFDEISKLMHTQ